MPRGKVRNKTAEPPKASPSLNRRDIFAGAMRLIARLPRRPAPYAGATLAAVMLGIVLNATALQPERLPAPFFATAKPVERVALAPSPPSVSSGPVARSPAPLGPPLAPVALASSPTRKLDQIADLLRVEPGKESQRIVATTQAALAKLGYRVKVNGLQDTETVRALREFEKARNLPTSREITPRLARSVVAAASEPGNR